MSEDVLENTIKVQRAKMNLTQEQLAELIGVTRKTVNTIENGKFIPSTVLAIKMARVFGLPVEELFILK
ncbi:helix-turn-helix transcriptional regulator [Paenibacillus hodogayensis]|uniref:Transcriptional regulator n=2 Tax=Paenibacillus TaxID=44249 RepID=A0A919XEN5_9BACL|nr:MULTISPECIES: helix-turn-helix transcriptional regulator [Paenibacillus]MCP3773102.1 helix-turn-helix transcriptional regulator [Paenibacillus sp. MZ04-78.2]GIO31341.1 transcriptional regulator [Paenibacillus albilobatus]